MSPSTELMNPAGDFRLKSTSNLRKAGITASFNYPQQNGAFNNAFDITGFARPAGTSDIGAFQTTGGGPTPQVGGGRMMLR